MCKIDTTLPKTDLNNTTEWNEIKWNDSNVCYTYKPPIFVNIYVIEIKPDSIFAKNTARIKSENTHYLKLNF